ncbi:interaptin-like [Drosophila takahashii]|uniref:interaptin-like n=1 Tax=Drosophila takahashii TaxID=29030 RepID=UPI003899232F
MNAFIRDTSNQLKTIESEQKSTQKSLQALKDEQETQMIEIHTMMDAQLLAVQTELENQSCQKTISPDEFKAELLTLQDKMDHRFQEQTQNHHKLKNQLSAAQSALAKQQTTLQNILNQIITQQNTEKSAKKSITKEDLEASLNNLKRKMEDQISAIQTSLTALMKKTEDQSRLAPPQTTTPKPPTSTTQKNYPAGTQQIGERFFYIENKNRQTWNEAAATCRKMNGFLASIKDKAELTAPVDVYMNDTRNQLNKIEYELKATQNHFLSVLETQSKRLNQSCQKGISEDYFKRGLDDLLYKMDCQLREQTSIQHNRYDQISSWQIILANEQKILQDSLNRTVRQQYLEDLEANLRTYQEKMEGQLTAVQASLKKILEKIEGQSNQATTCIQTPRAPETTEAEIQLIFKKNIFIEKNFNQTKTGFQPLKLTASNKLKTIKP